MRDYSEYKTIMRGVGLPLFVIGIILVIYSFVSFSFGNMALFAVGGFMMVIGFGLLSFSLVRPISKYYATEGSPAIKIASKSFGDGLKESGVLSNTKKEIIKIKCPHCSYLESEDAEFCSKCGKKI